MPDIPANQGQRPAGAPNNLARTLGRNGDRTALYLYGVVGDWFDGFTDEDLAEVLAGLEGPLDVYINSIGGAVDMGMAIYAMLARHNGEVDVHIDGGAFSIASVIALAGDRVLVHSGSMMMIHNPWNLAMGDAHEMRRNAEMLDKFRDSILAIYQQRTGIGRDELVTMMDETTWLTADEAIERGFADERIDVDPEIAASAMASLPLDRLPAMPEAMQRAVAQARPANRKPEAAMPNRDTPQAGPQLASLLNDAIDAIDSNEDDDRSRADVISAMASEADIAESTVNDILSASINCPAVERLEGFARVDGMPTTSAQRSAAEEDGCDYGEGQNRACAAPGGKPNHSNSEGKTMPDNNVTTLSTEALEARNQEIRAAFQGWTQRPELQALEAECLADPRMTADQARAKLLDKLGEGAEPATPQNHAPRVSVGETAQDKARAGMGQAILARVGAAQHDPANEYRGLSLVEMARASLETAGVRSRGLSKMEVAEKVLAAGMQTTSDFPVILEDTINRIVLSGYEAQPDTWSRFCRTGDVSDFRAAKRLRTGVIGNLNEVNEAGEYQDKSIPDAKAESIAAQRRGAIIQVSPETLVNDDLGEIQRMADGLGRSALRTIESSAYKVLNANPKLADGKALFHADHGNLAGTGAAPTVENIDAARQAMAQQTDVSGEEYLDIMPAVAVVPMSLGGTMRTLIRAEYNPDTSVNDRTPNKVNGLVQDIVDSARVSGTPWYLFADPATAPVIEVVFLDGQRQPRIVQDENFRTGGLAWRVELPFGVAPVDFRGAYKNPGA